MNNKFSHAQYEQLVKESSGEILRFNLDGLVMNADIHYLELEGSKFEYQYDHKRQTLKIFKKI